MMQAFRWLFRTFVPEKIRICSYRFLNTIFAYKSRSDPFINKFGVLAGFIIFYKLNNVKNDLIVLKIPHIKSPIFLRPNTSDISTFIEVFINEEYDIGDDMKPNYIIDGGANIGLTSIYFCNKYPNSLIHAVEPESSNIEILKANTKQYPNIHIVEAGIWHNRGKLVIANPDATKWAFRVESSDKVTGVINAVTIDDLMLNMNMTEIDILKMDIEGAEKEVFSGNTNWLKYVKVLAIEVHDHFNPGCTEKIILATEKFEFVWYSNPPNQTMVLVAPGYKCGPKWRAVDHYTVINETI